MKKLILIIAFLISFLGYSQKGIIVTDSLKTYNSELFKNDNINSVRLFNSIPKTFSGKSSNYQRTDGYHTLHNSVHRSDGFYGIVIPEYDNETHYLSPVFWDDSINKFTYAIISYTQGELNELNENKEDSEAESIINNHISEGERLFEKTYKKIWRRVHKDSDQNNKLTKVQGRKLARWFQSTYLYLKVGNWKEASKDVDDILTVNLIELNLEPAMKNTVEWLKTQIEDYLTNYYDL